MARRTKKTTLRPVVFDTDVLIWYFRGNSHAQAFLTSVDRDLRWISSLTFMELLQGCRRREEILDAQAFVSENISRILHPKTSISEKAIHLLEQYYLSHGLRALDALIGASALLHRAVLATANEKHFRFITGLELRIFKP